MGTEYSLTKSSAIDRFLRENAGEVKERRFGLPYIGKRNDGSMFNPAVQEIADAISFYGFGVRDENITTIPDTDLGGGNPIKFKPFPSAKEEMIKTIQTGFLHKYPYTEGADHIREKILAYLEKEGFINTEPYSYGDVDKAGLCVHNITLGQPTSVYFNNVINAISNPGDVILTTAPNYGLFTIRAERAGAEIDVISLEEEDDFLVNPEKLANKIDDINSSLQKVYNRRKGYVPRVVAFVNTNPNNPTGKVMGKNQIGILKEIAEVCKKRGVFIIDDLVYRDITYDKENIALPISTIPGMFRNTISLFSLSKSYSMAGLRAGFVVADELIIRKLINYTFQQTDSSSYLSEVAIGGAFNASKKRYEQYDIYFKQLRDIYVYKYNLLKALVSGIDTVDLKYKKKIKDKIIKVLGKNDANKILNGIDMVKFAHNLEPESGFFAILDFTSIKGMKYDGNTIRDESDMLKFFYLKYRIRFLVGQSFSWPYKDELVGRITFSVSDTILIKAMSNIQKAIFELDPRDDYIIRKNEFKDQKQIAKIKNDCFQNAYDTIISKKYLNSLDSLTLAKRYEESFEEYKDLVFVAANGEEILGYSCFSTFDNVDGFDSELVSLYVKSDKQGRGIGTSLFYTTTKNLASLGKNNMIVWCLSDNIEAIKFYENLGGKIVKVKYVQIGNEKYEEYGFYFQIK